MGYKHKKGGLFDALVQMYFEENMFGTSKDIYEWIKDYPAVTNIDGKFRQRSNVPNYGVIRACAVRMGCRLVKVKRGDRYLGNRMRDATVIYFHPVADSGYVEKILKGYVNYAKYYKFTGAKHGHAV